jgi:hypothetical protein
MAFLRYRLTVFFFYLFIFVNNNIKRKIIYASIVCIKLAKSKRTLLVSYDCYRKKITGNLFISLVYKKKLVTSEQVIAY